MFDLRSLEHSTIIYEDSDSKALLRLAWNQRNPNYIAVRSWFTCHDAPGCLFLLSLLFFPHLTDATRAARALPPPPPQLQTMRIDSPDVSVLDIRMPCVPAAVLQSHEAPTNGIAWAPHSPCHICTAADDHKALIWDVQNINDVGRAAEVRVREGGTMGRGVGGWAHARVRNTPKRKKQKQKQKG